MLNLLKLKQEKAAATQGTGEAGAKSGGKVIPAAQRRVQKGTFLARLPCQHSMHTASRWPCVSPLFDAGAHCAHLPNLFVHRDKP
jgi:hypothetical protein